MRGQRDNGYPVDSVWGCTTAGRQFPLGTDRFKEDDWPRISSEELRIVAKPRHSFAKKDRWDPSVAKGSCSTYPLPRVYLRRHLRLQLQLFFYI